MNLDTFRRLAKAIKMDKARQKTDFLSSEKLHVMKETTVGRALRQKARLNLVGATVALRQSANGRALF